jgi:hypothetical protein
LATAGSVTKAILGPLGDGDHAYLVVFVDERDMPLLILGFVPALGGDAGVGLGWSAEGVETDAIWGGLEEGSE